MIAGLRRRSTASLRSSRSNRLSDSRNGELARFDNSQNVKVTSPTVALMILPGFGNSRKIKMTNCSWQRFNIARILKYQNFSLKEPR
jgi:hypothetical protein